MGQRKYGVGLHGYFVAPLASITRSSCTVTTASLLLGGLFAVDNRNVSLEC